MGYTPWRVPLQVRYEGREFGSIAFGVTIDETSGDQHELVEPNDIPLTVFSIEPPHVVPCLDVRYQIAQKLHACTEPRPGGNDRVRDVIDIWLLEALLDPTELPHVKSAAVETFARRQLHAWPPPVEASPSWSRDYPRLATAHPDAPADVDSAVDYLRDLINRIDAGN